jgi:(E)-4-hydroxy-3-methyl-but-2-enyl pyrophosphate reductase
MNDAAAGEGPIAAFGSIVHNPLVSERLAGAGIEIVTSLDAVGDRPVAITAHGVGPEIVHELARRQLNVIDTTCPIVTLAQQWARKLTEEGYAVVVFGDPRHKEVRGILGWADGKAYAVETEDGIDQLPEDMPSRVAVLSQTTHTEARFTAFVSRLFASRMGRISELRVVNTLCNATTGQQAAAEELAGNVDVMIVVGGRESANTRHLTEICEALGKPTYQIEHEDELQPAWVVGAERVGLTAGASTPDFSIDAVEARLLTLAGQSHSIASPSS